ncbi:MAG: hypothetical protein R3F23_01855 [Verrucomicrobiia bacterium]
MKKWMILHYFFIFWCPVAKLNAQDKKFSEYISELWLTGKKQEALYIANQRLHKNSNDLSAWLVKLDYEMEFSKLGTLPETLDRSANLAGATTTTNFIKYQSIIESMPEVIKPLIKTMREMSPEDFVKEQTKGFITNKSLSTLMAIEALEADGLVAPISKEEMKLPDFPEQEARVREVNEVRTQTKKNKATSFETNKVSSLPSTNLIQSKTNQAIKENSATEELKEKVNWLKWPLIVIGLGLIGFLLFRLVKKSK